MTFQPVLPTGGYAGWMFLQRTLSAQQAAHSASAATRREDAYFREKIGGIASAADLVADSRLLRVSLAAFGLQDDLRNKAFLRKVLESSIYDPASFVNRLSDKRYRQLAEAFSFADRAVPRNRFTGFAETILTKAHERGFESALGDVDPDMRLALALQRDLPALASQTLSEKGRWYTVLGTPSVRAVFERAFGLPPSFGTLDVDRQVATLEERVERLTGARDVAQFARPEPLQLLTRQFLAVAATSSAPSFGPGAAALSLLQQASVFSRAPLR